PDFVARLQLALRAVEPTYQIREIVMVNVLAFWITRYQAEFPSRAAEVKLVGLDLVRCAETRTRENSYRNAIGAAEIDAVWELSRLDVHGNSRVVSYYAPAGI